MTATPQFRAPWFARNPHVQTLWGKFITRDTQLHASREEWETPDGDVVTVRRAHADDPAAPRFVLFHGLEGSDRSHYVASLFRAAAQRGWGADLLLWRSCGGTNNRAPRFYHSGETGDAAWFLERIAALHPNAPLIACGVSLGGNVLTKLLGDHTVPLPEALRAAVAVSVPFELARGSAFISTGASAMYAAWFLRSLRVKAAEKAARYPQHFPSVDRISTIRTLWEFDDLITGPLHGFRDARDYYAQSSSAQYVDAVRRPLLLLSAYDDPFLPGDVLDAVRVRAQSNPLITTEFWQHGGHVGFVQPVSGARARHYMADRIPQYLSLFTDAPTRRESRSGVLR
jgi:uncharacterized protein